MKLLYINEHTLKMFNTRANGMLESFIREDNDNNELKITYGYETRPNGKEFVKPILIVRNKWFLPLRIFEKDGIQHFKILSVLYDIQFFSSINLNFGLHTELKTIRFNNIEKSDVFFNEDYKYVDITIPFEDLNFKLEEVEEQVADKIITISNTNRMNKVLETKELPLFIKTLKGKVIELN